ncbi:hypothetical protein MJO29_000153, partial [Puccinia striiformis f. sp. tritici]
ENNYNVTVHDYTGQPLDMKLPQINNILLGFAKGLVALRGPPRGNVPTTLGADPAKLESADGTNVEAVEDADCEITAPTSPETSGSKKNQDENTHPDNERVDNHGGNVHIDNDDDDNIFED